jgi:hypothetical protein
MNTKPKNPKRHLTIAIWFSMIAMVVFVGLYVQELCIAPLHPRDGLQHLSAEERYEMATAHLRIVIDLLPIAAFFFMSLAYMIWRYLRERKDETDS